MRISFQMHGQCDMNNSVRQSAETLPSIFQIILFIGDGNTCTLANQEDCFLHESNAESQKMQGPVERNLKHIEARQKRIEKFGSLVAIFTLTMPGDDESLARQIACWNGGAWSHLSGGVGVSMIWKSDFYFAVLWYFPSALGASLSL